MRASRGGAFGQVAWRTAAAVAASCLVVLLVAWGALIGPDDVFTGPGVTPSTVTTTPAPTTDAPFVQEEGEPAQPGETPGWVRLVVWVLMLGTLACAAFGTFLLARFVKQVWEARSPRPHARREDTEFEVLAQPRAARDAVVAGEAEQDAALREGSARNGIVAAWHRFELQAADAGLQRHPWETSSEFVLRLLDLAGAHPHAVRSMAELYREARFSEHEIGEEQRARALDLLTQIRDGFRSAR